MWAQDVDFPFSAKGQAKESVLHPLTFAIHQLAQPPGQTVTKILSPRGWGRDRKGHRKEKKVEAGKQGKGREEVKGEEGRRREREGQGVEKRREEGR